jgi:DNA-directed RNA polymerase beta subunit
MATKAPASTTTAKRIRKLFGNIHEAISMPNLIEVQRESYEQFLRSDPSISYVSGLEKTLRSVFPIRDFAGTAELDFVHYVLEDPKYDTEECRQRGMHVHHQQRRNAAHSECHPQQKRTRCASERPRWNDVPRESANGG